MDRLVTPPRSRSNVAYLGVILLGMFAAVGFERLTIPAVVLLAMVLLVRVRALIRLWASFGAMRLVFPALFAISCLSLVVTPVPEVTSIQVARLWLGMLIWLAVSDWISAHSDLPGFVLLFVGLLSAMGVGFAVIAPFLVGSSGAGGGLNAISAQAVFVRISASLQQFANDSVNPNVLGGVVALLLPTTAAAALSQFQRLGSQRTIVLGMLFVLCGAVEVLGLWFSNSRGAWLAAFAGLLTVIGARSWRVGLMTIVVLASVLLLVDPALLSRIGPIGAGKEGPQYRFELWSRAVAIIADFPFTGIGVGAFQRVSDLAYPLMLTSEPVPHVHNLLLQIAVDLGIPGLVLWLLFLSDTVRVSIVVLRTRSHRDVSMTTLASAVLGAQAALFTHGLVDVVLWGMVRTSPLVWLLWGAARGLACCLGTHSPLPVAAARVDSVLPK